MDILVTGFSIQRTGEYVNDAELEATLIDPSGSDDLTVDSITLSYESGSDGNYYGTMTTAEALVIGRKYKVKVVTTDYSDFEFIVDVVVKERR